MKKHILFFLTMVMTSAMFAGTPVSTTKIEVYYFHFTRRCTTCQNVENVSKKAVETLYPEKVKNGQVVFLSVNLDEKAGEAIGAKYKIEGQTLIIISGNKRVDLTDKGFLYANDSPAKLKAEIKKAVDNLLK
ncbi:MAG: nitrophenyl compound nitroreductase subunit ArsF family protein [bacterium]